MERLDKVLSKALNVSRNDARALIKKGGVTVNNQPVKDISFKVDENGDEIFCCGQKASYSKFVYIMMNKPKGVISASDGEKEKTVVDILPQEMKRKNLFPAGRLDKDTTGFVLITDDGDFAHKILSPKNHITKTYIARLDKPFDDSVIFAFEQGVELKDKKCLAASLAPLNAEKTLAEVVIKQGMYHQVKRMFLKFGITVTELKRVKMGKLCLDESLEEGQCRYMTADEIRLVQSK